MMKTVFQFMTRVSILFAILPHFVVLADADFTPPAQFLVDKPTDLVAIVRVDQSENRWVNVEGNMIPLIVSECSLIEHIGGAKPLESGTIQTVLQADCSIMVNQPLSPSPIKGSEYLLWATAMPDEEAPEGFDGDWFAHAQGLFLLRGTGEEQFIYWDMKKYLVSDIKHAIQGGLSLPLSEVRNPVKRIEIAEQRIESGSISDVDSFIEGLAINVRDPEGQARQAVQPLKTDVEEELEFMVGGESSPHYVWFQSLALLRNLGRDEKHRSKVVAAIQPFLKHERPAIPFVTALALADLGDGSGKDLLIREMGTKARDVSEDSGSDMTYFGRFQYDDSSVLASAYALGRIGDRSGLENDDVKVQLVTADGLTQHGDQDLQSVLEEIATDLDQEVSTLQESGALSRMREPSNRNSRYPITWIKVHAMLGRLGSDDSFEKLVRAWIQDMGTYPKADDLMPRMQVVSFDSHARGWHTLTSGIYASSATKELVLERLQNLIGDEPVWQEDFVVRLRARIGDATAVVPKDDDSNSAEIKERISEQLKSDQPRERAEALAAAGQHQIADYYDLVLDKAKNGEGMERQASIYSLGLFGRPVSESDLRQILSQGDTQGRLVALEFATRTEPGRFAAEGLALARTVLNELREAQGKSESSYDLEESVVHMAQILGRMHRDGVSEAMVQALADPDPHFRKLLVQALGVSGNPNVVPHLEPLLKDDNVQVREAAQRAVDVLGPTGS